MRKMPARVSPDHILHSNTFTCICHDDGTYEWVPSRPIPFRYNIVKSTCERLKMAWDVFVGNADPLYWDGQ